MLRATYFSSLWQTCPTLTEEDLTDLSGSHPDFASLLRVCVYVCVGPESPDSVSLLCPVTDGMFFIKRLKRLPSLYFLVLVVNVTKLLLCKISRHLTVWSFSFLEGFGSCNTTQTAAYRFTLRLRNAWSSYNRKLSLKDGIQLLPGTQQRVLYNTIKYCSLSLSPSLSPCPFTLSCFLSHSSVFSVLSFIHSLLPDVLCYLTAFGCE